jgi:hypothetical protein
VVGEQTFQPIVRTGVARRAGRAGEGDIGAGRPPAERSTLQRSRNRCRRWSPGNGARAPILSVSALASPGIHGLYRGTPWGSRLRAGPEGMDPRCSRAVGPGCRSASAETRSAAAACPPPSAGRPPCSVVSHDQQTAWRVVGELGRHAAEHEAAQPGGPARTDNHQVGVLLVGDVDGGLRGIALARVLLDREPRLPELSPAWASTSAATPRMSTGSCRTLIPSRSKVDRPG